MPKYSLRLGTAANAPRIGNAIQELTLHCKGWRIRREMIAEAALTPSLKVKVSSLLTGEEDRAGNAFRYRTLVVQTAPSARRVATFVARATKSGQRSKRRTEPTSTPAQLTLMPLAAVGNLVERLAAGQSSPPLVMFAAEGGEAFRLDVRLIGPEALPSTPPSEKTVVVPSGRSWPVAMPVSRPPPRT